LSGTYSRSHLIKIEHLIARHPCIT
jgi:hypothetical protein